MTERRDLAGRRLVLGLSGGIACYKSAELLRLLVKAGAEVHVVMTEGAQRFITAETMQALSGRPVATGIWDAAEPNGMPHINLTRGADAVLVAPASADFIARLAQGRAEDLLSLVCLARPLGVGEHPVPLLLAPAMNREMWTHPATQRNLAQAAADGATLLGVAHGDQACGEVGDGRMLEAEAILEELTTALSPKPLAGRKMLITAGPTFEAIDPVRGITNLSSGKMGFAIARAAREAGAEVTLVAGPVHLDTPRGVRRINVRSAAQMHDAVLPQAPAHDLFVATAAVADWRPASLSAQKIKKDGKKVAPTFELSENPDILAAVAALPDRPYCVGFAAESEKLEQHAREKLLRKKLPLIVGNLGPATFGQDDNALLLVDAQSTRPLPADGRPADKLTLARALIEEVARRLDGWTRSAAA
ncbi:MAG: bifunctional phosphopantothenoylcysteine decarboxylase/phosphopantothenate--cysteine ligase CoaBC [Burkholderiales bacterium]|nr:bifunctional phosphopantothenoylcysteine decarboxylase/phosphopantothenate--cysteine ligase CoaBC [Burkholderiales bacterium]MBP7522430.1 bifunctional phosphopantothenoylcysteine decarboxylase/phosphopantothenate--cysteine ligase CoaBC [Leptothrix sp. (in: b-proteobacteria)]HQY07211.1 bifunctional phosphopantothenoylcysteine decarboxylase/phosphopantothenate--cysteine ligase CoaBC [Burkholderiaceae bacterium]